MSTSRLISLFVAAVVVIMAIFSIRAGMATTAAVSGGPDLSDYFQRHTSVSVAAAGADLSDYFLRHQDSASPADTTALDWFERHPESLKAGNAADVSDYYLRHRSVSAD